MSLQLSYKQLPAQHAMSTSDMVGTPPLATFTRVAPAVGIPVSAMPPVLAVVARPVAPAAVPLNVAATAVALLTLGSPLIRMAPTPEPNRTSCPPLEVGFSICTLKHVCKAS